MILPAHIIIALSSLVFTGYVYFSPSKAKLQVSYILVGLTIATGTWLIIANPAHMVKSCVTGLVYLGVVFFGILVARRKLAGAEK